MVNGESRVVGETVAQRSPDVEELAGFHFAEARTELAFDEIDDIDGVQFTGGGKDRVVEGEGAADERIALARQTEHEELAGDDAAGDFGRGEADAIGVLGEAHVLKDRRGN